MQMQGFPSDVLRHVRSGDPGWDQGLLRDMAGNMFTAPIYIALLIATLARIRPFLVEETFAPDDTEFSDLTSLATF